jgi:hypothetical protein
MIETINLNIGEYIMPIYQAMGSPKIYEMWQDLYRFGNTTLKFEEWVKSVYAEYNKVRINIYT